MRLLVRNLFRVWVLYWIWAAACAGAADLHSVKLPIIDAYDLRFAHPGSGSTPSHTRVGQIQEDNMGFIWLGTQDGLRRYDGRSSNSGTIRLKPYRPEPGNSNSLRGAYVEVLFKGSDGNLWISSDHFLDRFDPVTEVFTHYPSAPGGIEGQVYHISQDREGKMWLATDHGLVKLDPVTGKTVRYRHDSQEDSTLNSDIVRFTLETRDGAFWIATTSGLNVFDRQTGRVTRRIHMNVDLPNALMTLLEDHEGVLWVSYSSGNGLATVDRTTGVVSYYSTHEREPDPSQLSGIEAILEDQDGTLWFGTQGSGILKLEKDRKQFIRYRNTPDDSTSLSEDYVYCLFQDREGGIWAGTSGGGINRFSTRPQPFRTYRHNRSNPQSLADDEVLSVLEDSRGTVWVGTKGVLNRITRGAQGKSDQYTFYAATNRSLGLASSVVVSMAEDRSGYLWFGTFGGGLNRLDPKTGRFKVYRHDPSDTGSLADDVVTSLFVDHNGVMWAGSDTGISRFDAASDRFEVHRTATEPISQYHSIAEDQHGNLWLATWHAGLQRFNPATGTFASYRYNPGGKGISSDWVNCVLVDRDGIVWAGTQAGLNRLDPQTDAFTTFGEREGLSNSTVHGILQDSDGSLWLSTNNGLNKFDPRSNTFRHFYKSDGISANEFNRYGTSFQSSTGEMFFASYGGLTSFFPDHVGERDAPRVVLTDFQLNGKPVRVGPDSPLKQSISSTRSITLNHTQNIFSLEFAALDFSSQEGIRFRYRLRDVETEWNQTDATRRFVTYTNLSPGTYVFQVQCSNTPGIWNEPVYELSIRVLPAWWSTWWFRSLSVAVFLGLVWAAYRFRIRQLQHKFDQLRDVIETIPAMAWTGLPDGSEAFANRRWTEYSGLSAKEAAGSGWMAAVHADDRQEYGEKWRASLATGEPFECEARFRSAATKEYRWFLARAVPVRDTHGKILRWYGKLNDIEDLKRAAETLRETETRFRTFVDHATDAFFVTEFGRGTIVDVNRRACENLGYTREELIGKTVFDFDVDFSPEWLEQNVQPRVQAGESMTFETRHRRKNGTVFPVEIRTRPFLHQGQFVSLALALDITERKQAEEERMRLRQLEADLAHINRVSMMGELAASVAHEVNQPLSGIVSNSSACLRWLAADPPNLDEVREAVRDIIRDGKRAAAVIAHIRALTKRAQVLGEKLDLNETISEVLALVADETKKRRVVVRTQFAGDASPVSGDRVQLQQVVLNLIMNAMEAMNDVDGSTREIVITTQNLDEDQVVVSVEDSGTGLDPNAANRIFEPFYTTKSGGMGLGLSISRSIVESHGGRLWAAANEGPGTTFHFTLPKHRQEASLAQPAGA